MTDAWQDDDVSYSHKRDDNDDDVPDAWEDELEDKPKMVEEVPKAPVKAPPTTKNKQKKKFAGEEHASDEEFLESLKEPDRDYTPEELDELRKRAELKQEEAKLNMATELLGGSRERQSLDNVNLVTKEEFFDYSFRLYNRLQLLSKSEHYTEFLDDLLTGLAKPLSLDATKRMSTTLHNVLLRKQNEEREKKQKSKIAKPTKPQLKPDRRNEIDSIVGEGAINAGLNEEYDEDNDFM